MEEEVGLSIHMCIDLILTAIVVGVISSYAFVSYQAYNKKIKSESVVSFLEEKGRFYNYDNKIVSGSDVVSVINNNARLYYFEIKTTRGTYVISPEEEKVPDKNNKIPGIQIWSTDNLNDILGKGIFDTKFKSEIIYSSSSSDVMLGIRFTQEGV